MNQVAAGWYPDPENSAQLRWWDGQNWTVHVAPANVAPAETAQTDAAGFAATSATPAAVSPAAARKPRGPRIWNAGTWVTLGVCVALVAAGLVVAPMLVNDAKQQEAVEAQEVLDAFVEASVNQDESWRDSATPQFSDRVLVGAPIGGERATAEALDLKVETEVGELTLFANQWYSDRPPTPQESDMGTAPIKITYTYTFDGTEYTSTVEQVIWLARPFYYGDKKPAQYDFMKTPTAKGPWRVFRLADQREEGSSLELDTTMKEQIDSNTQFECSDGPTAFHDLSTALRVDGKFYSHCLYNGGESVIFDDGIDREDFAQHVPAFDPITGVGLSPEILGIGDVFMGVQHMPIMEFAFKGDKATYVVTFALVEDELSGDTRAALLAVQRAAESRSADEAGANEKSDGSGDADESGTSSREGAE